MKRALRAVLAVAVVTSVLGMVAPATQAQVREQGVTVSDNPADQTPHVLDGEVFAIAEVGNKIVLGGSFTQARNASGGATLTRNRILAFDKNTGVIDTEFAPSFNATVRTLVAGADGQSVIVGGQFATMNGAAVNKLLKLSTTNGARIAAFNPPAPNALVYDAKASGNRLFVGGQFTKMGSATRTALAEVDATTGALVAGTAPSMSGVHLAGATHVYKLDVSPDGQSLVAVGNFREVDGQARVQVAAFDLSPTGATLRDWATDQYTPTCYSSFDYYIRDVDFAPDGSYFVTAGTGGYRFDALCDAAARWETSARGSGLMPTWRTLTGADSLYTVAVTGSTVYVGGHQRWLNNSYGVDSAGPGAVSRDGIAALDPSNGVPLTWNPGRTRGRGVFDMIATETGLWVGSDTDRIGNYEYRGRIAFFPLTGGTPVPQPQALALPADVTLVGPSSGPTAQRWLYRINAGGGSVASGDAGPAWSADDGGDNPLRTSGSNASGWGPVTDVDATVPAGTPRALFDSERWDGGEDPALQWDLPVPAGKELVVNLYFANRCDCTAATGARVFDVAVDGVTVLDDFDIMAPQGVPANRGTMRSFTVQSDGNLDIDFSHVVENPLVNAIEVIDPSVPVPAPSPWLYRINAGGPSLPSLDSGPDWSGDTDGSSPVRDGGSSAGWDAVPAVAGSVPASTPRAVFDSERYAQSQWNLPVPAGTQVQVRLYFANRCGCTSAVGSRVFDVAIDGATVLDDFDIVQEAGDQTGTVRTFTVTSDGTLDIDLSNVVENALVNGIEVIDPGAATGPAPAVTAVRRGFDGATVTGTAAVTSGPSWDDVRGTFWAEGQLYTLHGDGTLRRRTQTGSTFGAPTSLGLNGVAAFASEMQSMTSIVYDRGYLFFTLAGQSALYSRPFSVQSAIVGTERTTVATGASWSQVRGAFLVGGQLYWSDAAGTLHRTAWTSGPVSGPVPGSDTVVSGPGVDGVSWRARAVYAQPGTAPNAAPVARGTVTCTGTLCTFSGSTSSDADGSVVGWTWTFPGGATATGATVTRQVPVGASQVQLVVTDDDGATGTSTVPVSAANAAPQATFTVTCAQLTCTVDGSGSSDPDGSVASYAWQLGDGATATGATATRAYTAPGSYTVTLTVTDDRGATAVTTRTAQPSTAAIQRVAAVQNDAGGSVNSRSLTIPTAVQAGDTMVLFLATNSATTTVSDPAGWTRRAGAAPSGMNGVLWTRTATATDAGSTVASSFGTYVRAHMSLSAYRGASGATATMTRETATRAAHTTPTATAPAGSWVVSYWADKTATTTAWTAPAGTQLLATGAGTGAGHMSWLLVDSGGPVPAGTVGGLTATADSAAANAVTATVVLTP